MVSEVGEGDRSVEMATMNLQPLGPFCFKKTEEWPKWKRRFEQYRVASGLGDQSESRQVSTLLYCLGEDAEDILDTIRITAEDKKKYDKVVEAFDHYFQVRKNVIFERTCFNRRSQLPNESVEQFITEVHRMADSCEFGVMKDQLVRDRLVVGILDSALSERLQMEPDLTLDKAKKQIRQREAVKEQQATLKLPTKEESTLDSLASRGPRRKLPVLPPQAMKQAPIHQGCKRCGRGTHPRQSAQHEMCYAFAVTEGATIAANVYLKRLLK